MEQFDAILTGSDSPIEGIVTETSFDGNQAWDFKSIDETLHLVIARNPKGGWVRVDGTEPYLSGWVDELAELISKQ
jgi:uncharacterized Fe-S cluster-containing radical SAM superfamily protein